MDPHFDKHRRTVLAGIALCNVALVATVMLGPAVMVNVKAWVCSWSFFPVAAVAILARDRRVVMGCLVWLIGLYPLSAVWG